MTQAAELELIAKVDCSIVHTSAEHAIIQEQLPCPLSNILVFPFVTDVHRSHTPFEARRDIMFLGGFAHSPNVDGVTFFVSDVWPKLCRQLPEDAKLLIVGAAPTQAVSDLANERIVVTGYVPELEALLRPRKDLCRCRCAMEPGSRLNSSKAWPMACLRSPRSIAVEGMGIVSGQECIVADDSDDFACGVLKAYNDPDLWRSLQVAGYAFVEEKYSWARCLQLCTQALDMADMTWLRRQEAKGRQRLEAIMGENGEFDSKESLIMAGVWKVRDRTGRGLRERVAC